MPRCRAVASLPTKVSPTSHRPCLPLPDHQTSDRAPLTALQQSPTQAKEKEKCSEFPAFSLNEDITSGPPGRATTSTSGDDPLNTPQVAGDIQPPSGLLFIDALIAKNSQPLAENAKVGILGPIPDSTRPATKAQASKSKAVNFLIGSHTIGLAQPDSTRLPGVAQVSQPSNCLGQPDGPSALGTSYFLKTDFSPGRPSTAVNTIRPAQSFPANTKGRSSKTSGPSAAAFLTGLATLASTDAQPIGPHLLKPQYNPSSFVQPEVLQRKSDPPTANRAPPKEPTRPANSRPIQPVSSQHDPDKLSAATFRPIQSDSAQSDLTQPNPTQSTTSKQSAPSARPDKPDPAQPDEPGPIRPARAARLFRPGHPTVPDFDPTAHFGTKILYIRGCKGSGALEEQAQGSHEYEEQ